MDTDRNLLFAVLALHAGLFTRDQFVAACTLWGSRKTVPLADLAVEQGWLSAEDRAATDALLARKLARHGNRAGEALATVAGPDVRDSLAGDLGLTAVLPPLDDPTPRVLVSAPSAEAAGESRYQLSHLHATGGIGRVWLATDPSFEREVALKELRPERAANPSACLRFLREARITGRLQHPGIVPVYDLGTKPGSDEPFYTMRFVRGRTFAAAIQDYHEKRTAGTTGALERRELLSAFVGVCRAVHFAHDHGIIHRDLKPQNVVLGDYGEVMVLDWGLAKEVRNSASGNGNPSDQTTDLSASPHADFDLPNHDGTQEGQVLGTPAYMAPEQAAGRLDELGAATDVYGLGAILYELLAGAAPFNGPSTEAVLKRVREVPPLPPRSLVPTAPRPLEAVCRKCMEKVPSRRYPSAAALADEVRRFLADEPVTAFRDPLRTRVARWGRRRKPLVAAGLAAALVLAVGGTAFGMHTVRERDRVRHETALREEETRRETEERIAERLRAEDAAEEAQLRTTAEARHEIALATARAGDIDAAITALAEVAGFCNQTECLAPQARRVGEHLHALERFRSFRTAARLTLRKGIHNIRTQQNPDPILRECEAALALYEIETRPDWWVQLAPAAIAPAQIAEARRLAHELLAFTAIRLAMRTPKDDPLHVVTRRALALLDRAEVLEELSPGLWMLRLLWLRRIGENAKADAARDKAAVSAVNAGGELSAKDCYILASILLQLQNDPKRAIVFYRQAIKLNPNHYGAHFGLYLCFSAQNDLANQIAPLSACIVLEPNDPELYYLRGMAHFALEDHDKAFEDFDTAVLRDPKFVHGYFYRGRMHVVARRWKDAEIDFTRTLDLDPDSTHARSWRAIALAKLDRYREAGEDAERAVREDPDDWTTLLYAARAYAQMVRAASADEQEPQSEALAQLYGDRSVELLGRAIERGFKDGPRLGMGSDFDPIRTRPDFKALQKKLGAK